MTPDLSRALASCVNNAVHVSPPMISPILLTLGVTVSRSLQSYVTTPALQVIEALEAKSARGSVPGFQTKQFGYALDDLHAWASGSRQGIALGTRNSLSAE